MATRRPAPSRLKPLPQEPSKTAKKLGPRLLPDPDQKGKLYEAIVDNSDDAIMTLALDGTVVSWNSGAERMLGYNAKEIVGKSIRLIYPPERHGELMEIIEKVQSGEGVKHHQTQREKKDGTLLDVSLSVSAIRDQEGKVVGLSSIARDISEEKRFSLWEAIVESSDDAVISVALDGTVTSWNPGATRMLGYTWDEIVGKHIQLIYPPERRDELTEITEKVQVGDQVEHHETQRRAKDGSLIDISLSVSAIRNAKGEVIGLSKIARDITGQKRVARYARSLIEASLDPLVTISTEGKITDVNEATVQVTGVTRERLIGSDFSDYFTEPEKAREGYRQVFSKGTVTDYPLTIRSSTGNHTDVLYNASLYRDDKGVVLGVFAAARDVTAQKQASQYARSLIEASLDPLVTISPDGKVMDVNEATVKVTGVSRDRLVGTDFSDYFTEPEKAREGYQQVFAKSFVTDYPLTIRHKNGKVTDVLYNASVYKDVAGMVLGVFAAARDVTESKRVLRDFAETRTFLDNILESSTKYSIIGKDLNRRILSWNEGARRNYGYTAEEIIGKDSNTLHTPEDITSGAVEKLLKVAYDQGLAEGEFERVRKDGSRFMASLVITRRNDASGQPIGYLLMSNDISEKKSAEEQLRQASQYSRSLIEASLDPLVTISPEGIITDVNEATAQVTGASREKLIGSDFSDYFTEPDKAREGYRQVFSIGTVTDYPLTIRSANGKLTDVLYNASVYRDDQGSVLGVFAAARDVTAQKQASQYARSLIEASLDPLVTISPEGKITDVNEATVQVTGVSREKLIGADFSDFFTEPEEAREGYLQVFQEGFVRDYPLAIRHASGRVTEVIYNATVYRDTRGNVLGVFAAARDITERKKVEEQLLATSAYARSLIEASLDPLVTISPEGKITDVNHATELTTGVSREWLIGTDFSNYFTEPRMARRGYRLAFRESVVRDYPLAIRHASGRIVDVLYNATVYRDAVGKVRGVFAAARDVTATKQASQYARSLIEASLDPLVTISAEGKITDVNEATVQVTGVNREKLIGSDFSDFFTEPEKAREGYRQVFSKGTVTDYPLTIRSSTGKLTDVLYNASVYRDDKGNVLGVFAAARDYSRLKQTSVELEQSNKELEAFSYTVSHDLRAPLRAIDGFSQALREDYGESLNGQGKEYLDRVKGSVQYMSRLIDGLLSLSRLTRAPIRHESVDLSSLAAEVAHDLRAAEPKRQARFVIAEKTHATGDPVLLRTVLENLLSNAWKFTSRRESATIEFGSFVQADEPVFFVRDNGAGFDPAYSDKLFTPFQRLHKSNEFEGTGIGLAAVARIVKRHGGRAWAEGAPEAGATFYFTLQAERRPQ